MKRFFLIAALACMSVTAAFAQKDKSGIEYQNLRGPFLSNRFCDNWFISVGAGADTWLRPSAIAGEEYKGFDKGSYMLQVGVGKMLSPYYGVRAQLNYGNIKGRTSIPGMYTMRTAEEGKFDMEFDYWSVEADFLFHFSNAVSGYKEARFYNALLFAGFGYAKSMGDNYNEIRSTNGQMAFNFGLLNTFRLAPALDLYAEAKFNLMNQNFSAASVQQNGDYFTAGTGVGMIPSLTFGLTYKFNDRRFYKPEVCDFGPYQNRISQLEKDLAASQALAEKYKNEVRTVTETSYEEVPLAVFFRIGESTLTEYEMLNIRYVADVIKKNPDQQKVYTIIGMADKETGNPQLNQRLSVRRARVVKNALVRLGIDADRLETKALGDRVNPFQLPEMNRVVIIE